MSEFSELIKQFDKIRDYMRDFYVYGFKSRDSFSNKKSLRSYDNEKRRIESYLSDYMSFHQTESGKSVFLSVDSSDIPANPLYRAFKAKTFTKNDITLHFMILDILCKGDKLSANEISDKMNDEYLVYFEDPIILDLSTIRNKLSEYAEMGILYAQKHGRKLLYSVNSYDITKDKLCDAVAFFSEVCPVGVIGSFLLDNWDYTNKYMSFKHHYIMHALESEIVYELLEAMHKKQRVEIVNHFPDSNNYILLEIVPLKILISAQGGRRYVSAYSYKSKAILNFRLDYIKSVKVTGISEEFDDNLKKLNRILKYTWGASFGKGQNIEHLSMTLSITHEERFIINRISREGRHGILTKAGENIYRYDIDVYDSMEMMPWIRTFIGRIISLRCTNRSVENIFYRDLEKLYSLYDGGDENAVQ